MHKHTPGPWVWQEQRGSTMPRLLGGRLELVCDFGSDREYYPSEGVPPEHADALLIAVAPELLEALQDARYALYGNGPGNPKIDAVIAKALGE